MMTRAAQLEQKLEGTLASQLEELLVVQLEAQPVVQRAELPAGQWAELPVGQQAEQLVETMVHLGTYDVPKNNASKVAPSQDLVLQHSHF